VVVTGSSAMVSHREAWSEQSAAWIARVALQGTPVLGICYGHQLLAHGLGGTVGPNPRGREIGTVDVHLRAEGDALLGALPDRVRVQASHVESVLRLPDGARLLAANAADPHHAYAVGDRAWGVQFHPEFDADIMRGYVAGRRDALTEEALDPDHLLERCADSAHGEALLARFGELVRESPG
jgi:GMP synthase (glutamine-hydrolysing)